MLSSGLVVGGEVTLPSVALHGQSPAMASHCVTAARRTCRPVGVARCRCVAGGGKEGAIRGCKERRYAWSGGALRDMTNTVIPTEVDAMSRGVRKSAWAGRH